MAPCTVTARKVSDYRSVAVDGTFIYRVGNSVCHGIVAVSSDNPTVAPGFVAGDVAVDCSPVR